MRPIKKQFALCLILITVVIATVAIFMHSPIPQDVKYHDFADKRMWFGVPYFNDFVSNIFLLTFGGMGLLFILSLKSNKAVFKIPGEKFIWGTFFFGVILIGFGSGFYHWNPSNASLVYDRMPIAGTFMILFSLIIMDRVNELVGLTLCPILILLGIFSVLYWNYTESLGSGDLRLYVLVQFTPIILIPTMMLMLKGRYTESKYIWCSLSLYLLAKFFEHFDWIIFENNCILSGHSIKHFISALGVYVLLIYLQKRRLS